MACDLCGKDGELFIAVIEGTRLKACASCAKFGEIKGKAAVPQPKHSKNIQNTTQKTQTIIHEEETIEVIREDYATVIRRAREKKGLKQEEFAKALNEKESIIHSLEAGKHAPNIPLARKLEKILNIQLVNTLKNSAIVQASNQSTERTIGDIIKKSF